MLRPSELTAATDVLQALLHDLAVYFSDEVRVFAAWVESPTSVCVVYRRTIDPEWVFGRRITFPPHAMPDDPRSTGADAAEFLREPAGASMDSAQTDSTGIIWLGLAQGDRPTTPFD
jgi:hypothetical protein